MTSLLKPVAGLITSLAVLVGCASPKLSAYEGTTPPADIEAYFTGPISAWGVVQDWKGHVVARFDVKMVGTWEGDTGTLDETFTYYDGVQQKRVWTITKHPDGTYTGTAGDIVGEATGAQTGTAINWAYQMDLEVDGKTWRLTFDDWMWQMNDGVMINRSYMKKFGLTVAELTLFMKKDTPAASPEGEPDEDA